MTAAARKDPEADNRYVLRWLGGIWIVLTALILGSMAMTLLFAWPPTVIVFFIGVWLVVSVFFAFTLRRRRA